MNASEWIDTHGVPKDWALAVAILEQIASYRAATRTLIEGPKDRPKMSITRATGLTDERYREIALANAHDRVSRPIIDVAEAQKKVADIEQSGGWAQFIYDPEE